MNVKVLYAPEYGVPQIRKRAFFVGLLNSEEPFIYPDPILTEDKFITCEQAIGDLPSLENDEDYNVNTIRDYPTEPLTPYQRLMRKNSDKLYNHTPTKHAQKTIDNIKLVPDGGKYTDLPSELSSPYKFGLMSSPPITKNPSHNGNKLLYR